MNNANEYQQRHNGPLNQVTIDFLHKQRIDNNWSYATLGGILGVSGAFVHNILNKHGNITTSTAMQKIAAGIDSLKAGDTQTPRAQPVSPHQGMLEHSYNLRGDLSVKFRLPTDLTEREAERLSIFMRSLAQ